MPSTAHESVCPGRIALALVVRAGHVLVRPRSADRHLGGLWEWPGGKCAPGESPAAAAARELHEETGLEAVRLAPLITVPWRYPDRTLELHAFRVDSWRGKPRPPAVWVTPAELMGEAWPMPAANRGIAAALSLPPLYAIAPGDRTDFTRRLQCCLEAGLRLVYLRGIRTAAHAERWARLCLAYGATPMLDASLTGLAAAIGAGVHLHRSALMAAPTRPHVPKVGASCHDERELAQALHLGVDLAVCSPVLPTPSHQPPVTCLGWDGFARLAAAAVMPVYALGGMHLCHVGAARAHGAQGVAMLSGMGWDTDPAAVVRRSAAAVA